MYILGLGRAMFLIFLGPTPDIRIEPTLFFPRLIPRAPFGAQAQ